MDNQLNQHQAAEFFMRLWQNSPDNMFALKVAGNEFYVVGENLSHESSVGLEAVNIAQQPLRQLLPAETYQIVTANYKRCIQQRQSIQYDEEESFTSGDGSTRYWNTILTPIFNSQDDVEYIFGVSRNISELIHTRQKAETAAREARHASQVKTNFLANMSHELRTPLNGIKGALELIRSSDDSDEINELLQIIEHSADAMSRQTEDLLDYSKTGSNTLKLNERVFSLAKLLKAIEAQLHPLAEQQENCLQIDIAEDVPDQLCGDCDRIQQIILNLGSNANKFTEKGCVQIEVSRLEKPAQQQNHYQLQFVIRDNGIGIRADDLSKLFQPFSQLDDSTTRKFTGTGLGLAICKNLVEMMGGTISVESKPGQGSAFTFTLSLVQPHACELLNQPTEVAYSFSQKRILLVEDNPTNQLIVRKMLEKANASVQVANHGLEALEQCQQQDFDLILMDWHMPEMDGLQATRALRQAFADNQIPVIGLTASVLDHDQQLCLDAGMDAVIAKPVSRTELLTTLARFLDQSEQS